MATLHERHYGVTEAVGRALAEAAAVCLSRHHVSPVDLLASYGSRAETHEASWSLVGEREREAWANDIDTTEAGAYAVAIATVEVMAGLEVVSRAPAKSGADYRVGTRWPIDEAGELDLEPASARRLEVSGMDRGSEADLLRRLNAKAKQITDAGPGSGCAVVVGFEMRRVALRDV